MMILEGLLELHQFRIGIISGDSASPMFSCFDSTTHDYNVPVTDIIMRCKGSHFTLLQPLGDDGGGGGSVVSLL